MDKQTASIDSLMTTVLAPAGLDETKLGNTLMALAYGREAYQAHKKLVQEEQDGTNIMEIE